MLAISRARSSRIFFTAVSGPSERGALSTACTSPSMSCISELGIGGSYGLDVLARRVYQLTHRYGGYVRVDHHVAKDGEILLVLAHTLVGHHIEAALPLAARGPRDAVQL